MRVTKVFAVLFATLAAADLDIDEVPVVKKSAASVVKFDASYFIKEQPHLAPSDVASWQNTNVYTLTWEVTNQEEEPITLVGAGGSFRSPGSFDIVQNATAAPVGPLVVEAGQSASFEQPVDVDIVPGNYAFTPQVFFAFNNQLKIVQARPQLLEVSDKPLSLLDPQLLFIELIVGGIVAAAAFSTYQSLGQTKKPAAPVKSDWLPKAHKKKRN